MSYAFPRTLSYPYPADGPVRVGMGSAPVHSGLGLGAEDSWQGTLIFGWFALLFLAVPLSVPVYFAYKLVTSAKDE